MKSLTLTDKKVGKKNINFIIFLIIFFCESYYFHITLQQSSKIC